MSVEAILADAGTIILWNIYLNYGDINLLKESYNMMKYYVNTLINKDKMLRNLHIILEGFIFGNWLVLNGENAEFNKKRTDSGFIIYLLLFLFY